MRLRQRPLSADGGPARSTSHVLPLRHGWERGLPQRVSLPLRPESAALSAARSLPRGETALAFEARQRALLAGLRACCSCRGPAHALVVCASLGHPSARRSLGHSALPPPSACCCALPHPARLVACGMDELVAADAAAAWRAADPERRLRSDVAASTHDGGGAGCERVCGAVPPSACRLAAHPKEAASLSSSDVRGAAAGCSSSAALPLHARLGAPAGEGWSVDDARPRCLRVTRAELARPPPHRCSGSARALAVRPTSSLSPPPFLASSTTTSFKLNPYSSTMASVVQGITHLVQGLFEAALGLVRGIFSAALAIVNTIFSTIFGLLVSPASSHLAPLSAAADLSNSTASTTSSPA